MEKKQTYTKQEKIEYYTNKIARETAIVTLKQENIRRMEKRLEHIKSDEYQDWNSDTAKDLKATKARKRA